MTKLTRAAVEARLEPYAALGSEREIAYALLRAWDALEGTVAVCDAMIQAAMDADAVHVREICTAALPAPDEKQCPT